jgi:hypothetical protein
MHHNGEKDKISDFEEGWSQQGQTSGKALKLTRQRDAMPCKSRHRTPNLQNAWSALDCVHDGAPLAISCLELLPFSGHLKSSNRPSESSSAYHGSLIIG